MDNNQKKIMPGCEKLTKPEEISALRDYLRQGIQDNEASLVIGDENDPVTASPGNPILGKVDLETKKKVLLDGSHVEVKLNEESIKPEVPRKNIKPGDYLDSLEDNRDINPYENLSPMRPEIEIGSINPKEYVATINGNYTGPTEELLKIKENTVNPKQGILELIENNVDPSEKLINLDSGQPVSIKEYREPLSNSKDISSLSYFLSQLDIEEKAEIEEDQVELLVEREFLPETHISSIEGNNVEPEEGLKKIESNPILPQEKIDVISENLIEPEEKRIGLESLEIYPYEYVVEGKENTIEPTSKILGIEENLIEPEGHRFQLREGEDYKSWDQEYTRNWIGDNNAGDFSGDDSTDPSGHPYSGTKRVSKPEDLNSLSKTVILDTSLNSSDYTSWTSDNSPRNWIGDNNSGWSNPDSGDRLYKGTNGINKDELDKHSKTVPMGNSQDDPNNYTRWNPEYTRDWIGDNNAGRKHEYDPSQEYRGDSIDKSELENYSAPLFTLLEKPSGPESTKINSMYSWDGKEQEYLNLGDAEYETYLEIKNLAKELEGTPSGNWVKRVMSYLQASLSKTEKWRKTLDVKDKDSILSILQSDTSLNKDLSISTNKVSPSEKLVGRPDHINPEYENFKDTDNLLGNIKETTNIVGSSLRSIAEETAKISGSFIKDSAVKQDILDSTLYSLVSARNLLRTSLDSSPSRLPGFSNFNSTIGVGLLGGASIENKADKALDYLFDAGTSNLPLNRPSINKETGKIHQSMWSNGHGKARYFKEYLGTSDDDTNIKYSGVRTTLEDLCPNLETASLGSLEDLKELLEQSPYITTSSKVNKKKVMTLDSNHVWELRLFPYIGKLNGECSWLPSIAEINSINYTDHGVRTRWGDWIPVNSFELQSRKMTQKTLGLYDGEISYPISMEFTNELRLSIIDDQYKSWKRYFELCSECSTYLTKMVNYPGHYVNVLNEAGEIDIVKSADGSIDIGKDYTTLTEDDLLSYAETTPIVKGTICPGMYKNLSFRCLIYVMTPQMSTIQKFDLLVVLKDYTIEYTGEADASSPDLNISFSIVGENPGEAIPKSSNSIEESKKDRDWLENTIFKRGQSTGEFVKNLGHNAIQSIISNGIGLLK